LLKSTVENDILKRIVKESVKMKMRYTGTKHYELKFTRVMSVCCGSGFDWINKILSDPDLL
jgi:hypothetical protein